MLNRSLFGNGKINQKPQGSIFRSSNSLTLAPGAKVNVEMLGTGERLWGEIFGCKNGELICIWLPQIVKYKRQFMVENQLAIRVGNAGCYLCGFRTTISHMIEDPYPLLFLNFPDKYEQVNLRRSNRFDCFLPSTLYIEGNELSGAVVNISQGGAKVIVDMEQSDTLPKLTKDMEIFLRFDAPDVGEVYARCIVKKTMGNFRKAGLGICFEEVIGDGTNIVKNYISKLKQFSLVK
ncbi:PilZ domain-containing protein [Maridesulfovibrio sp.]|uniref:PilZ domain-containing protein n=1 Tax=Maridesulfovibrio sp. TaxID=2795000 RepID=UPI0029C9D6F0|nr:PilZ domain-containing protein [Maridesulfovibrio sp.]